MDQRVYPLSELLGELDRPSYVDVFCHERILTEHGDTIAWLFPVSVRFLWFFGLHDVPWLEFILVNTEITVF